MKGKYTTGMPRDIYFPEWLPNNVLNTHTRPSVVAKGEWEYIPHNLCQSGNRDIHATSNKMSGVSRPVFLPSKYETSVHFNR